MLDAKSYQIGGFNDHITIDNVFTYTYDDSCSYSLVDLTKPPKFDDPPFEILRTCMDVEALQLPLMVMSSSHDLDEITKLDKISISSQDSLCNTISSNKSSFLENSYLSDLSSRKYFHLSSFAMHFSFHYGFSIESSTPTIFLNL